MSARDTPAAGAAADARWLEQVRMAYADSGSPSERIVMRLVECVEAEREARRRAEAALGAANEHRDQLLEELDHRLVIYSQSLKSADDRARRAEAALEQITRMGRVCGDFVTCQHVACADSSGAVLVALDALASLRGTGWGDSR